MSRSAFAGLLVALCFAHAATAATPPRDRFISVPDGQVQEFTFVQMCEKQDIPCLELSDGKNSKVSLIHPKVPSPGMKVGAFMDALVKKTPGYRWFEDHGVLRLEPIHPPKSVYGDLYAKEFVENIHAPSTPAAKNIIVASSGNRQWQSLTSGLGNLSPDSAVVIRLRTSDIPSALDRLLETHGHAWLSVAFFLSEDGTVSYSDQFHAWAAPNFRDRRGTPEKGR